MERVKAFQLEVKPDDMVDGGVKIQPFSWQGYVAQGLIWYFPSAPLKSHRFDPIACHPSMSVTSIKRKTKKKIEKKKKDEQHLINVKLLAYRNGQSIYFRSQDYGFRIQF